jgi:alcohol oxidase
VVEDRKYTVEIMWAYTDFGRCGCVVAGRLANLDHNLQVLLIEGGENNLNNPWVFRPGIYPRNMKLDSKTASFYYSRPSEWLDGRRAVVPCAHILGGGSSINFMVRSIQLLSVVRV